MSDSELLDLFREELNADVTDLRQYVQTSDHAAIKGFAHKYKIRLHYLGYIESFETCQRVEQYFKEDRKDELMSEARQLLDQIMTIQNAVG